MLRPIAVVLFVALGLGGVQADTPQRFWIDAPAAQPWIPALTAASVRTGLPVALIAELIGTESGFRPTARCSTSSAAGLGQQIRNNRVMARHKLDRMVPAESIMGSALELRLGIDATGTISGALYAYGTTAALSPARRRAMNARMEQAARYVPVATVVLTAR